MTQDDISSDPQSMDDGENPMERIWEKLPKQRVADGSEFIEYALTDIPYLYNNGFVDAQAYTLDDWLMAFIPFKADNGMYRLNKEQFLSLRQYRYEGIIRAAFDPMRIREGEWTEEDLWKLYYLSIKPSSTLTDRQFTLMIDNAKKKGLFKDGKFILDQSFKQRVKLLIDQNPSPLRRLELRMAQSRQADEKQSLTAQKTQFAVGKTKAQETTKAFAELLTKR